MKLFQISSEAKQQGLDNADINNITENSQKVEKGDIFICIKGANIDGHSFAEDALKKGVAAIVVEKDLGLEKQILVSDSRAYFAKLASNYYGNPTKKLKLIGVTGTNGKTTVVHIIKQLLAKMGEKCGSIGTTGCDTGNKVYESDKDIPTTPPPMQMYRYFREMVENKVKYCVMEVSSQALSQCRLADETFVCSAFTNLTPDHLDWHKTMENYYQAKKALFDMSEFSVVNIGDDYGKRLYDEIKTDKFSVNTKGMGDFYSENVKISITGSSFWLMDRVSKKAFPVISKLLGYFNVDNIMISLAVVRQLGFDLQELIFNIEEIEGEKGRAEIIYNNDFFVVCDFAHSTDSLDKILNTIRTLSEGRVLCLFGAAGERDSTKRPKMGEAVAKYSDYIVVTSDNPRHESPQQIITQVVKGIEDYEIKREYKTFIDRKKAIYHILGQARSGDVVLLAGKGHENYQVIGDDYIPFDEREIVKEYFKNK